MLRQARGWQRLLLAFALGGVMALAMPPFNLFPLLWLCLPASLFLLQGAQTYKQAFVIGWSFAFGFFVFGLYWIAASMFVDIGRFWWAVPFAVAGLPAYLAIYYGLAAVLARKIGTEGIAGALAYGLLWFAADVARGVMFTGFPWNLPGYAWSGVLPVLQITSVIGIYGLTLLTILAALLPAALVGRTCASKIAFNISVLLFIGIGAWGEVRLRTTELTSVPNVRVRLVQPNITQETKWQPEESERNFEKLLALTSAPSDEAPTFIFWPETASTFFITEDAVHRYQIAREVPAAGAVITGALRRDVDRNGNTRYFNSLVAIDGLGRVVAGYDKAHLVPFGEFMPLRKYNPIPALAVSTADFTPGPGPRSLRVLGLPLFSPLVCYEAIFPGHVADPQDRPQLLVNVTNDGWYGNTTGPYQHFAIARIRAIEEGLPLIRIANTGISGFIDPLGRVEKRLGLEKTGFLENNLKNPIPLTAYALHRENPVYVGFFLLVFAIFLPHKGFWHFITKLLKLRKQ